MFRQYLRSVLNFQFCRNKTFLFNVVHRDFPQKMASALSENPASVIHSLNLAHNTLDNQGTNLDSYELFFPPPAVSLRATLIVFWGVGVGGGFLPHVITSQLLFAFKEFRINPCPHRTFYFLLCLFFLIFFLSYISSCRF